MGRGGEGERVWRKEIGERRRGLVGEVVVGAVAELVWDVWVCASDVEEEIDDVRVVGRTRCVERSPSIGPTDSVDVGTGREEGKDEVGLVVVSSFVEEDGTIASPLVDLVHCFQR